MGERFDATPYLTKLSGKDYLEVRFRILWLRTEHPDAVLATEMVQLREDFALFKATVTLSSGASATGYGSETPRDFKDYIEKAESKSLGRALAALGFGTQFAAELNDESAANRPVDTPTMRPQRTTTAPARLPAAHADDSPQINRNADATPRQIAFLKRITREAGWQASDAELYAARVFGKAVAELNRGEMSDMIDAIQQSGSQLTSESPISYSSVDTLLAARGLASGPPAAPKGIAPNAPTQAQKDERNRLAKALGMNADDLRGFVAVMFDGRTSLTAEDVAQLNAQLQRELDVRSADPDTGEVLQINLTPTHDDDDFERVGKITDITHAMDTAATFDALREVQAKALADGLAYEEVVVSAYSRNFARFNDAG